MWTVIYMVQSMEDADNLRMLLENANILVKIKPVTKAAEGEANAYEILIPETEKEEAHSIIIGSGY
ncbi:MAG: hypothetical protein IJD97_01000 [Clostridia bacterium]|nr:hypothetical protein [Clostridia bacterium]